MNTENEGTKEAEMENRGLPQRLRCAGCGQMTTHRAVLVDRYGISEFTETEYIHYCAEGIPHHLGGWCPGCDSHVDLPLYRKRDNRESRVSPSGLYYEHVVSNIDDSEVEYGTLQR